MHVNRKTKLSITMKKTFLLLAFLPFLSLAKIHTVDNTPGNGAMFSSLQTAISSASSGDTIIVMRSLSSYGSISIKKKLLIYSDGHHQASIFKDRKAQIEGLSIESGSDGSSVSGFYILNTTVTIDAKNIVLTSNFFDFSRLVYQTGGDNSIIEGNIFWGTGTSYFQLTLNNSSNNIIKNNWFSALQYSYYPYYGGSGFLDGGNSTNLFVNNLISESNNGNSGQWFGGPLTIFKNSSMSIHNNIFWSNSSGRTSFDTLSSSATFKNNITYSASVNVKNLPGTNNINNTAPTFETSFSGSNPPTMDFTYDLRLKSSSAGKNSGTDSTDIGPFGGGYFFSINGNVRSIPIFDDFYVVTPVVKRNGKLKIKLIARKPEN